MVMRPGPSQDQVSEKGSGGWALVGLVVRCGGGGRWTGREVDGEGGGGRGLTHAREGGGGMGLKGVVMLRKFEGGEEVSELVGMDLQTVNRSMKKIKMRDMFSAATGAEKNHLIKGI